MTGASVLRPVRTGGIRRSLLALVASAVTGAGLLGASLGAAAPVLGEGPLPACRYADILTSPRAYDDWSKILVDTILEVPKTYVPPDLTLVSAAGLSGTGLVRALVIPDLTALAAAANDAGNPLAVQSAYRSYSTQVTTFAYWVSTSSYNEALLYSARPGHSEHQLGLAIDFKSAVGGPPWSGSDWGLSPAGAWMKRHAWEYGFVQSYPKGQRAKTCYDYESWHFRYVGRDEAAAIHASGLTLREYLWRHYTTTTVAGPGGSATSTPGASAAASSDPSASPSVDPGASPATDIPTASNAASASTSGVSTGPPASPGADPTLTPLDPVGTWFGLDPAVLVGSAALAVVVLALFVSLALGRRRGRSS
jgi:zinc D-Ala-D-Ala carboxypeptidase